MIYAIYKKHIKKKPISLVRISLSCIASVGELNQKHQNLLLHRNPSLFKLFSNDGLLTNFEIVSQLYLQ